MRFQLRAVLLLVLWHCILHGFAGDNEMLAKRKVLADHILTHYPEQLGNPQKKNRKSFSQFGYNLYYFTVPLFPITQFINPKKFGIQSYGQPSRKEKNGVLYTCKGGFMDFSHIRCGADWTVYLTFKIITENGDFDLPHEGGHLHLHFQDLDKLTLEDIASLAQKIAFERLAWHEAASWHYHLPNYTFNEQQSTFTPEDIYSDMLGTVIGKNIALRILKDMDVRPYSVVATEEIEKMIASLQPVKTKKASAIAYDIVDRHKQLKLPEDKRNKDVWYDSKIIMLDERYVFKRYMNIGPQLSPWLVPESNKVGCPVDESFKTLKVPEKTKSGIPFTDYYVFTINPDSSLFYNKRTGKQIHEPFDSFTSVHLNEIVKHVGKEMEEKLMPGFDKRDNFDPVPSFKRVRKVIFK